MSGTHEVSATAVHCSACNVDYDEADTMDCPDAVCVAERVETQAILEREGREAMREDLYDPHDRG